MARARSMNRRWMAAAAVLGLFSGRGCGCDADRDLAKLNPVGLSVTVGGAPGAGDAADAATRAWALFDRDTTNGWTPDAFVGSVHVSLGDTRRVRAIKVFGPAPYVLDVARNNGRPIDDLTAIDLSTLPPGWTVLETVDTDREPALRFAFTRIESLAAGPIPEIEVWGNGERPILPDRDDRITAVAAEIDAPAHILAVTAAPASANLSSGGAAPGAAAEDSTGPCATFAVALDRDPRLLRRAYLLYEAHNVFRPFSLERSVNGAAFTGGEWLAPHDGWSAFVEPIDSERLQRGPNEVMFCLPDGASGVVTLRGVRLLGEMEHGGNLVDSGVVEPVVEGEPEDAADVVLDADPSTTLRVLPERPVVLRFDRATAPDALLISSEEPPPALAAVECLDGGIWIDALGIEGGWPLLAPRTPVLLEGLTPDAACAALRLRFAATTPRPGVPAGSLAEVEVIASGSAARVDWAKIAFSYPRNREHFGAVAYVSGWVAAPTGMTGPIQVSVDDTPVDSLTGAFGVKLTRSGDPHAPWPVTVRATLPDGATVARTIVLDLDHGDELLEALGGEDPDGGATGAENAEDQRYGPEGSSVTGTALPGTDVSIRLGTHVGVDIPAGAVLEPTDITIKHLDPDVLPALDAALINVTAPRAHAYEFLPHGQEFVIPVTVLVPYDADLLPEGMGPEDVNTYYYDINVERWLPLDRLTVDPATGIVRSLTDHFTIMIDAVLAMPESPTPLSLDPNALSSLAAADPGAGIDLIEPPTPSSSGDARLSLPIRLPPGRGAYEPSLAMTYSSSSGNGWLGVGWDLRTSRIEIDTRFGVPRYTGEERYLLDGEALVPTTETNGPDCTDGATKRRYRARVEGAFVHIVRCGTTTADYHWEVRDKAGTLFVYGESAGARLASYGSSAVAAGTIFAWHVERVEDTNGNRTIFEYEHDQRMDDTNASAGEEDWAEIYPFRILYTVQGTKTAPYVVELMRDAGDRLDRVVSARSGFKVVTRFRLANVRVKFAGSIVREYALHYVEGEFSKSLLERVEVWGAGGVASGALFDTHDFEYFTGPELRGFEDPVEWTIADDLRPKSALNRSFGVSTNGHFYTGYGAYEKGLSIGVRGGTDVGLRFEDLGFMDLNGDGLPDRVFLRADAPGPGVPTEADVWFNHATPDGANNRFSPFAPAGDPFAGLDVGTDLGALSLDLQLGTSLTAQAFAGPVTAGAGYASTLALGLRLMNDVNGDGFVDLVRAGSALLNTRCAGADCPSGCETGDMCFVAGDFANAADLENHLAGDEDLAEVRSAAEAGNHLSDPIRRWTAPFAGNVLSFATVRKPIVAAGGDGVTVELFHDDALLASVSIGPGDDLVHTLGPFTGLSLDVLAGENLYVRVTTIDDTGVVSGALTDAIELGWSLTYETACDFDPVLPGTVCPAVGAGDYAQATPTGHGVFAFDATSELRLAGPPLPAFTAPAAGTIAVTYDATKSSTSDEVRFCVQHYPFTAPPMVPPGPRDVPCAATDAAFAELSAGAAALIGTSLTLAVEAGDFVVFRMESDFAIDPARVSWAPAVTYTIVCPSGPASCGVPAPFLAERLTFAADKLEVFVPAEETTPAVPHTATVVSADGDIDLTGIVFVPATASGPVHVALRSPHRLLFKDEILPGAFGLTNLTDVAVSAGESLTFEVLLSDTSDASLVNWLVTSFEHTDLAGLTESLTLQVHEYTVVSPGLGFWGGGYRGWSFGVWDPQAANALGLSGFDPTEIGMDLPPISTEAEARAIFDDPDQTAENRLSLFGPMRPAHAGTTLTTGPAWIGGDAFTFVNATIMHGARSTGAPLPPNPDDPGDPDADSVASAGDATNPHGMVRLALSKSFFASLGVGPLGLSAQTGVTKTKLDVRDVDGDGVADIVTPDGAVFTEAALATLSVLTPLPDFGGSIRRVDFDSFGFNAGINPIVNAIRSSGRTEHVSSHMPAGRDVATFGVSLALSRNETMVDLVDVNGDGLPDRVFHEHSGGLIGTDRLKVRLGLGHDIADGADDLGITFAFSPIDDFPTRRLPRSMSHSTAITLGLDLGFADSNGGRGVSIKFSTSGTRTAVDLADLNGDGLADLLYKRPGEDILVKFNLGDRFAAPAIWTTPAWPAAALPDDWGSALADNVLPAGIPVVGLPIAVAETLGQLIRPDTLTATGFYNFAFEIGGYLTFTIPLIYGAIILNPGIGFGADFGSFELAMVDMDGDGATDHVLKRTGSPFSTRPSGLFVKRNKSAKANLLRAVNRPLGGRFELDYERTPNSVALPQSRWVMTSVRVDDGVDLLDASYESPDLETTYAYEDGFFHRGEKELYGFATVVESRAGGGATITRTFDNANYALRGRLLTETVADAGGAVFTETVNTYGLRPESDASTGTVDDACVLALHLLLADAACESHFPALLATRVTFFEGGATSKTWLRESLAYDAFGNLIESLDHADDSSPGDDVYATATYTSSPTSVANWLVGLPASVTVLAGGAGGATLRHREASYDGAGNLTELRVDTGSDLATTNFTYDLSNGNLASVEFPPNASGGRQRYDYVYDATTRTHVTSTTDAFGYSSTAAYDLRFGLPTTTTDLNGNALVRAYDDFGRLASVRGPYDGADAPAVTMSYFPDAVIPRAETVNRASPPPGYTGPVPTPLTTVSFVDGLGRPIQLRKTSAVGGASGTTASGLARYDVLGRVVARYHPFFVGTTGGGVILPSAPPPKTKFVYDILDRVTETTAPDGTITTVENDIAAVPSGATMFRATVTDPNGNEREIYRDVVGRIAAVVEHPGGGPGAVTGYGYLPTGEVSTIADAAGNATTLTYDRRGLWTSMNNPDTGLIELFYDEAGNLIRRVEPNHRAADPDGGIRYLYELDRLLTIDYPSKTDVTYTYGAEDAGFNRAGRIRTVTDETGVEERFYGALGETTKTIRTVNVHAPGRSPMIFTTEQTFDSLGRMLRLIYPDGERLTYTYDAGGLLSRADGVLGATATPYISDLLYDVFGNRTHARFGNEVVSNWSFDPLMVRLSSISTVLPSGEGLQDLVYGYDAGGNPTDLSSFLPVPGPSSDLPGPGAWRFTYDGVDRLVSAHGDMTLAPGKVNAYDASFSYSDIHNLLLRTRVHTITTPGGSAVTPPDTNLSLDYEYGSSRPHAPTRVGTTDLEYDPSGNLVAMIKSGTGNRRDLIWDDDNRLAEVSHAGETLLAFYDADGNRVVKRGRHGETVFANPYFTLRGANRATKHIFAGPLRVASSLVHFTPATASGGALPCSAGPPGLCVAAAHGGLGAASAAGHDVSLDRAFVASGGMSRPPPTGSGGGTAPPAASPVPARVYYFHADHLGSTNLLTDRDGELHEHLEYFPEGAIWIDRGPRNPVNDYRFSGKTFDPETGFYDFGQRYYDPNITIWLGVDPILRSGVPDPEDTTLLSPYLFTRGNSIRFVDPTGELADTVTDVAWFVYDYSHFLYYKATGENALAEVYYVQTWVDVLFTAAPFASASTARPALEARKAEVMFMHSSKETARAAAKADAARARALAKPPSAASPKPAPGTLPAPGAPRPAPGGKPTVTPAGSAAKGGARTVSPPAPALKIPKPGARGKLGATDIPSYARGKRPFVGESGAEFAERVLREEFGPGTPVKKGPGSDFSMLKKFAERHFVDP